MGGRDSQGHVVHSGITIARLTAKPAGLAQAVTPDCSKAIKMVLLK